jgi:hypothetical protein
MIREGEKGRRGEEGKRGRGEEGKRHEAERVSNRNVLLASSSLAEKPAAGGSQRPSWLNGEGLVFGSLPGKKTWKAIAQRIARW